MYITEALPLVTCKSKQILLAVLTINWIHLNSVTGFSIDTTPTGISMKINACPVLQHDELGTRNISVFHIFQHSLLRKLYKMNTFFLQNILLQFISRIQKLGNSVLYLSDDFMPTGNIHAGYSLVNCCHNIMQR
jgi:hypothetical protein